MKKWILPIIMSFVLAGTIMTGQALAEDDTAVFTASDWDYQNYLTDSETFCTSNFLYRGSTTRFLGHIYSGTGADELSNKELGCLFFSRRGVSVGSSKTPSINGGNWIQRPAIFVVVFPDIQQTAGERFDNVTSDVFSGGDGGFGLPMAKYSEIKSVRADDMTAISNMNYEEVIASCFGFQTEEYDKYTDASISHAKVYADVNLERYDETIGEYLSYRHEQLTLADKNKNVYAWTGAQFMKSYGLVGWSKMGASSILSPGTSVERWTGDHSFADGENKNKAAKNGVLFCDLNPNARYRVIVTLSLEYKEAGNETKTVTFKQMKNNLFGGETMPLSLDAVNDLGAKVKGKVQSCLYAIEIRNDDGKVSMSVSAPYRGIAVSGYYASLTSIGRPIDLENGNPLSIMTDPSFISTAPADAEDRSMISSVFRLLRLIGGIVCIFGFMGTILCVAKPYMSGIAMIRLREAVEGWALIAFLIGAATFIISTAVQLLFFYGR